MHIFGYSLWLIKEIIVSGCRLAFAALFSTKPFEPVVVHYPLRVSTDWQLFWFSSSITVTPSTLSIGFRDPETLGGQRYLIVQAALGGDPAEIIAGLADMEARMNPKIANQPLGEWKSDSPQEVA
ncbi:monovalent cation/H+ antiporter subunit E [Corynebacterium caspium]|uniref:monovalent cation/H+ antiporter subunit E n=1 Tax=Corynebacterium caspium TaxID=234828 RepID=UPI00037F97B9|nr:monovalent cation/H+ antiporter subunit E [Corynebacterium caspium]WKD58552.1 putative monovalent cation/H+ antiporter subunit E [Corynebacterium caspium DSM 44850]